MDGTEPSKRGLDTAPALAFIEANLFAPMTLGDIAATCGLSAYHFSRVFTARHGESVMAYVRGRRMRGAADRLATEPDIKLIDLALDCGFESQEAFTRAFTRMFGVPPGRWRRGGAPAAQPGGDAMAMDLKLQQSLEARPAFTVVGFGGSYTEATRHEIPQLWDKLIPRLHAMGRPTAEGFGVGCGLEGKDGAFTYVAGVELKAGEPRPQELPDLYEIPPATYLVFRHQLNVGALHPQMSAALDCIWSERVPSSGYKFARTPDFEFYPATFNPMSPDNWVAYYIPVVA